MSKDGPSASSILEFWRMLELLNPQPLPSLTPRATSRDSRIVVGHTPSQPLPWEALRPPSPIGRHRRVWRHTVYLGLYSVQDTYDYLHRAFFDDQDGYDERPSALSACAAVLVDEHGRLVPDATVLSSAAWAVGRLRAPGPSDPGCSSGFTTAQQRFASQVQQAETARQEHARAENPLPLDHSALAALLAVAHRLAGVSGVPALATADIRVASAAVTETSAAKPAIDFLNSFHLSDLEDVHADVLARGAHGALAAYLAPASSVRGSGRLDVVESEHVIDHGLGISALPLGRWPEDAGKHLARSQQFAVNLALRTFGGDAALLGVNGPPGTGKTTMLREVLAGNVVERARRLAELERAQDAFEDHNWEWEQGGFPRTVRQLRPEFTGFEMVVASSNNLAVENVSVALPTRRELGQRWRSEADYFAGIAAAVAHASGASRAADVDPDDATLDDVALDSTGDATTTSPAWGLIAARLGRSSNRTAFRSAFWFGAPDSAKPDAAVPGMQDWLKARAAENLPRSYWRDARARFRAKLELVESMVADRAAAEGRTEELRRARAARRELDDWIASAAGWSRQLHETRQAAEADVGQAEADLALANVLRADHVAVRPGLWELLTTFGRASHAWRAVLATHDEAVGRTVNRFGEVAARLDEATRNLTSFTAQEDEARRRRARVAEAIAGLERRCALDRDRYGTAFPGTAASERERELRAPWLDEELDAARSSLFLAAMDLHRDFLAATAREMAHGLRAAIEVVSGSIPPRLEEEKIRAAWQLFFLAVPLVSTTFSSLGRMFAGMGRESIGWLIVDEAGQTSPQHAVGGIWRARRVLAVGDPLQLEPVTTAPRKAVRDIAATFGVSTAWIPPRASVQTLADRVTQYGTTVPQGEEDVWVGSPLRVHRRCDEPMFSLSNTMAYDGLMIQATPARGPAADSTAMPDLFDGPGGPLVQPSFWADVPATQAGSHLQLEEIARVRGALDYLKSRGVQPTQVIAISPFRAVATALERVGKEERYAGLLSGTIHTAQGREADVVLLVLGSDPSRPGARAWATSRVNLINVAVSRAKRRLYVIGDHDAWRTFPYTRAIADALPVRRRDGRGGEPSTTARFDDDQHRGGEIR